MVDTNVTAVAILTKLFAAGMVERNRGHIINISSVAAHHAYPGIFSKSLLESKFRKKKLAVHVNVIDSVRLKYSNILKHQQR